MGYTQWARARPEAICPLRRGAWYRLLRLTPIEAVLDVDGRPVAVARSSLHIVSSRPTRWTVVPRPRSAGGRLPTAWGPRYAVCPNCRSRARLEARAAAMHCSMCGGFFDIGWDDPYFAG